MGHLWLQSYDFVWFDACFYMQNISQIVCFLLCCTTLSNNATLTHLRISTLISAPHFKVHQWFLIALRIHYRLLSLATKALHNQTLAYSSPARPFSPLHCALASLTSWHCPISSLLPCALPGMFHYSLINWPMLHTPHFSTSIYFFKPAFPDFAI